MASVNHHCCRWLVNGAIDRRALLRQRAFLMYERRPRVKKKTTYHRLTGVADELLSEGVGEALGARQGRKTGEQAAQSRGDVWSVFVLRVVHRLLDSSCPRALHLFNRTYNRVCNGDNIFQPFKIRVLLKKTMIKIHSHNRNTDRYNYESVSQK